MPPGLETLTASLAPLPQASELTAGRLQQVQLLGPLHVAQVGTLAGGATVAARVSAHAAHAYTDTHARALVCLACRYVAQSV